MHDILREIDPLSADLIHKNNVKRVIRAIEFYKLNGIPISEHNLTEKAKESPYDFKYFVLNLPRDILYKRIDLRVDKMFEAGLIDEVKSLRNEGLDESYVSMQGLGYKEVLRYLDGDLTLEECSYIIKRDTRHFAKRQITWFNRERDVIWINKTDYKSNREILDYICDEIKDIM